MKVENIILSITRGFDDEFNKDVSFNVFRGNYADIDSKFYQSCYNFETAIKLLLNMPDKQGQPNQFKLIKNKM